MKNSLLLMLLVMSVSVRAETEEEIRRTIAYETAEFKKAEAAIPQLIEKYAATMGCGFSMNPANVLPYQIKPKNVRGYVAIYNLDLGCSGGSSMSRPYFVFLQKSFTNIILVNPTYSNPLQTSQAFPATVKNIFLKQDELWFKGVELGPGDALCCPSAPINGKVQIKDGRWEFELNAKLPGSGSN